MILPTIIIFLLVATLIALNAALTRNSQNHLILSLTFGCMAAIAGIGHIFIKYAI